MEALLEAALRLSAPLLLAALGELVIERAGLINVGIEGTLLTGAFAGFVVAVASGSPLAGVAAAAAAGVAVGCLFAAFTVLGRVDQIVVGTAVNLIALGATGAAARALYGGAPPSAPTFGPRPCTMFNTPGGRPASLHSSPSRKAVMGVTSEGLATAVFPVAKAGAIFHVKRYSGRFHGEISPATPRG